MTPKQRSKFDLYRVLLNTSPSDMTDNEARLLHDLAVDDEVQDALERQNGPRRRPIKDACSVAGCGCSTFRAKPESLVYCRCSHLTHDHYKRKRT